MIEKIKEKMRTLPAMDILLSQDWVEDWISQLGRDTVKSLYSELLSDMRRRILVNEEVDTSIRHISARAQKIFAGEVKRKLRPVVNATGVVIHTNLGRSCLAAEAVEAVCDVASSYSTLEYELEAGTRGSRNSLVEGLLCRVTGAEAALVVNNNAAAVVLCLSALANGAEVIVSRGELVEIGGSFRIPDIMKFSGAKLVEVGTTNRTHLKDYADAITNETAMILKVHPSNFRMEGFTANVPREELSALAEQNGIAFMEDAGSGLLVEPDKLGLEGEDSIRKCISDGADIVTFSGDKMLGGPQIGVAAGKRELIGKLKGAQIMRAFRVDKMTLAAFEATLKIYLRGDVVKIPSVSMLKQEDEEIRKRANKFASLLRRKFDGAAKFSVIPVEDAVGGGAYPAKPLKGWGVSVTEHAWGSAGNLQALLRLCDIPVVAGAQDDRLIFHVRTLLDGDEGKIVKALDSIFSAQGQM
ncbi:MAG: L-seryl-tRNA(Sec) selenium transferase [Synergistaceae bacterium]|nr:L-seryl-tRNA(Sec) selenium transferase [Synergistaceae bacterium]